MVIGAVQRDSRWAVVRPYISMESVFQIIQDRSYPSGVTPQLYLKSPRLALAGLLIESIPQADVTLENLI